MNLSRRDGLLESIVCLEMNQIISKDFQRSKGEAETTPRQNNGQTSVCPMG